jgi:hypothetical protein
MRNEFAKVLFLLAMLGMMTLTSLGQASKPSVYMDPQEPLAAFLAASMADRKVPIELVTDRARAAYILSTTRIRNRTSYEGTVLGWSANNDEIKVAEATVALIDSGSRVVVWSDFLREPTEGDKTEQSLADLAAKRLKKFIEKNHGDLAVGAKSERSHSIAAMVGSLFSH